MIWPNDVGSEYEITCRGMRFSHIANEANQELLSPKKNIDKRSLREQRENKRRAGPRIDG